MRRGYNPHTDMSHRPENVAELLIESKDLSELMVDLAYAAVSLNDEEITGEIDDLRHTLSRYLRRLRRECVLAARSLEDARLLAGVIAVAAAIEEIGHAASDIARVVTVHLGIPAALRADLAHAREVTGRVRVRAGAQCVGRSLAELHLPKETGIWLLAIRRGRDWRFDPQADSVLAEGDVLLFRGPGEGVNKLRALAGAPPRPAVPPVDGPAFNDLERAVDLLVEMKDAAETAVGLAYSAVSLDDTSLAAEVASMEARANSIRDELESWVLHAATVRTDEDFRGLLRLGETTETMFDAARALSALVLHRDELHPLLQLALEETEEIATEVVVEHGSRLLVLSLEQVGTETGVSVLALQRRGRWLYRPSPAMRLEIDDRLIAIGSEESVAELASLVSSAPGTDSDGRARAARS